MSAQVKSSQSKLARAALWYATQFGWRVFPLHTVDARGCSCKREECGAPGKHPRTQKGCLDATSDAEQVKRWWTQWPDANVGVATGRGLVVVDIDPAAGGDDGFVECRKRLGALPDTVEALTGGGGRHIYLATPAGVEVRNSASTLARGVDVRGDGGYVVAAPSVHASGKAYAWEASSRPEEVEVAAAPTAWLEALTAKPKLRLVGIVEGEPFPEGERNTSLYKRACSMRSTGFERAGILAAILAENETRCIPPLDPAEVKGIVDSACKLKAGLSPEYQAKRDEAAARKAARDAGLSAAQPPNETGDWQNDLIRSPKGLIKNTFANICAILRNAEEYRGLRYNEMLLTPEMNGRAMADDELGAMREAIERRYGFSPGADALSQALITVSSERSHHPVREYLSGLTWDGVARLDHVARIYLGAEETPITVTMLRAWFISCVARAMNPGCKVDTALVLVGRQGVRKSSFFRALGGDWFSDTGINLESKDAYQQLRGSWIFEWGEIEYITSRAHASKVKAFITSQVDTFRPPFMRALSAYKRTNVIVGSTNEDEFLNDPTGSRRFWVVRVGDHIDLERLIADRAQLWAEAVASYRDGEAWWLSGEAETERAKTNEDFRVADPWEGAIATWLEGRSPVDREKPVTTRRLLVDVVGMKLADIGQSDANRIAAAMKRLGYRNRVQRVGTGLARVWEVV